MKIIRGHIDLDNESIIKKCIQIPNQPGFVNVGPEILKNIICDRFMYNDQPHTWDELAPLVDEVLRLTYPHKITKSWFNMMVRGSYIVPHLHNNEVSEYVCTYYARCLPEHPSLEILDKKWTKLDVVTGDYLIFSKSTWHRVEEQTIDDIRFCISFNI